MSLIRHLGHSENDSPWKTKFAALVGSNIWTLRFTTKELAHKYRLLAGAELLSCVGFDVRKFDSIPPKNPALMATDSLQYKRFQCRWGTIPGVMEFEFQVHFEFKFHSDQRADDGFPFWAIETNPGSTGNYSGE